MCAGLMVDARDRCVFGALTPKRAAQQARCSDVSGDQDSITEFAVSRWVLAGEASQLKAFFKERRKSKSLEK